MIFSILIILASLLVLLLLIALLIKNDFNIQKETIINQPKTIIFNYIKLLKNQERYSVWVMKDPDIKIIYTGTDGAIGATSAWESKNKNVGVGEQEIIKIITDESIQVEIRFKKPFEGINHAITTLTAITDNQTKVSTQFYGKSKFPMNIMNLMMDKLVGKDMEQNLIHLKNNLETT